MLTFYYHFLSFLKILTVKTEFTNIKTEKNGIWEKKIVLGLEGAHYLFSR